LYFDQEAPAIANIEDSENLDSLSEPKASMASKDPVKVVGPLNTTENSENQAQTESTNGGRLRHGLKIKKKKNRQLYYRKSKRRLKKVSLDFNDYYH